MKIGILGGSFDPIHNGHIHMAVSAYRGFSLDQVWLVPAGHSPNKAEEKMTSADKRLRMCEIASLSYPWLISCPLEVESGERSYTYRTLQKLTKRYPLHRFSFIMGGDSLDYFETWNHPEEIAALARILVVPRDTFSDSRLKEKIRFLKNQFSCEISIVPCTKYPVSSTEIRKRFLEGKPQAGDFPPGVLDYILKNHLYGQ